MNVITLVTDNHAGVLADVTELLAQAGVNIETIDASRVRDWAVIGLEVNDYAAALHALRGGPFTAFTSNILLVCIDDKPGALARVARILKDGDIDVGTLRIVGRDDACVLVALSANEHTKAAHLLRDVVVPRPAA